MVDCHALGVASAERESVAHLSAFRLAHEVRAALLVSTAVGVLAALDFWYADVVLAHLQVRAVVVGPALGHAGALDAHLVAEALTVAGTTGCGRRGDMVRLECKLFIFSFSYCYGHDIFTTGTKYLPYGLSIFSWTEIKRKTRNLRRQTPPLHCSPEGQSVSTWQ